MTSSARTRHLLSLIAFMTMSSLCNASFAGSKITRDPPGTDRPGHDFAHHTLNVPDAELCVNECLSNQQCSAYTYVRPGVQGVQAVCWLKTSASPAVRNSCCTSGRKSYLASNFKPHKPTEIQPPETPNKWACSLSSFCANNKSGHWNSNTNSCECQPLKDGQ